MALFIGPGDATYSNVKATFGTFTINWGGTEWFRVSSDSFNSESFVRFGQVGIFGDTRWAGEWSNAVSPTPIYWQESNGTSPTYIDVITGLGLQDAGEGRFLLLKGPSFNNSAFLISNTATQHQFNSTYVGGTTSRDLVWGNGSSLEAIRFNMAVDNILIGRTTTTGGSERLTVEGTTISMAMSMGTSPGAGGANILWCAVNPGGTTLVYGGAWVTTNNSSFLANVSDYRRKTNVQDLVDGFDVIGRIKPRIFKWRTGSDGRDVHGFLAHEVQEVLPESVMGEPDAVNPDGTPRFQMMERSHMIPWLTAAIKQLDSMMQQIDHDLDTLSGSTP